MNLIPIQVQKGFLPVSQAEAGWEGHQDARDDGDDCACSGSSSCWSGNELVHDSHEETMF